MYVIHMTMSTKKNTSPPTVAPNTRIIFTSSTVSSVLINISAIHKQHINNVDTEIFHSDIVHITLYAGFK